MKNNNTQQHLHQLARLYGIETSHRDINGRLQKVGDYSLLEILKALGAPLENMSDLPEALRHATQERWEKHCEPVVVIWQKDPICINLRIPEKYSNEIARCKLKMENGEEFEWKINLENMSTTQHTNIEGINFVIKELIIHQELQWGYHWFECVLNDLHINTLIISAPYHFYNLEKDKLSQIWGAFMPLYSIQSENNWGAGDFSDLKNLVNWTGKLGGNMIGTLPLLSSFLDQPFDPSPYAPVSRMFWNEFYLNINKIPELKFCPEAQHLIDTDSFKNDLAELKSASLIDYRRIMSKKRKVLEKLARCCFENHSNRRNLIEDWIKRNPLVIDYARFRAATEKQQTGWPNWPSPLKDGIIRDDDYDLETEQYHLYVQWICNEQLEEVSREAKDKNIKLYLDFPLGINSDGYDIWRERESFALKATVGAPPDMFFSQGQNWGVLPMHPINAREQGYNYYINSLRHHLQYAGILRLDHIMGLHRLFWIPEGYPATEGAYVHYNSEEFYAILALESHRHQSMIVGEDLGLVPDYVREEMNRHKTYRMFVLPFELNENKKQILNETPQKALTCLNTHDIPPFATYWANMDKKQRKALINFLYDKGWLNNLTEDSEEITQACLEYLAYSQAELLLVNIEDLWLETESQNVPGTFDEHPNWRRKARYTFESFSQMPNILEKLNRINKLRTKSKED